MEIPLTDAEAQVLVRLLESHISDLRSEVYHAESHDVKVGLKDSEAAARALLNRIEAAFPQMAPV